MILTVYGSSKELANFDCELGFNSQAVYTRWIGLGVNNLMKILQSSVYSVSKTGSLKDNVHRLL